MSEKIDASGETIKQTAAPRQKVVAAAGGSIFGSSIAIILLWIFKSAMDAINVIVPPEVSDAFTAIIAGLLTFFAGYYMPPGASETTIKADDGSLKAAIKIG